jgi:TolB-like protein/Tfp pilus assembly protein PilF
VNLSAWFQELKRRRVFRALAGYALVAFALLQVAEPVMHGLGLPEWVLKVLVIGLGLGLPVTILLAWAYDLKATGIERTPSAEAGRAWRTVALVAIGLLLAAPGVTYYLVYRGHGSSSGSGPPVAAVLATPSVAVLPFADMSEKHDQEYFADGVTEEILNALARVEGLRVAARTSAFAFKGKNDDLVSIAQKLRVGSVVEGSVRLVGSRIRITAQLINAADGFHVWSQTYDRELTGVLAIQDEIARAVVSALKVKLLPGGQPARAVRRPAHPEAYSKYLLARELSRQGRRAAEAYEEVLDLDAGFAPAWASLSSSLLGRAGMAEKRSATISMGLQALASAEKAITLDPDLPDGYLARAAYRRFLAWDFLGAASDTERALALSPGDAQAHFSRGEDLMVLGRVRDGIAEFRAAADLDPLNGRWWAAIAFGYVALGEAANARTAMERALELGPDALWGLVADVSLLERNPAAALAAYERAPDEVVRLQGAALAQHDLGQAKAAQEALEKLKSRFAGNWALQIAEVHAWWGERDEAFEWLERAYRQHDALQYLKANWLLRSLRDDPRYTALLKKVNLPVD